MEAIGRAVWAGTCVGLVLAGGLGFAGSARGAAGELAALDSPVAGVEEVVFAVRPPAGDACWFANFGYYAADPDRKAYSQGGRLCRLDLKSGRVTTLLEDAEGGIRDPQVHYDAAKVVFSYRPGDSDYHHLYEIDADGQNLRQLTDGPFDDIEPSYLPDGAIVFCSTRCKRWTPSWTTPAAIMYRCEADGRRIRPVSGNTAHDNTPWPLPDGRVLYTRWEHVDRSQADFHHLWTKNPDGTAEMTFFGNLNAGDVMIDAKPIPNTRKVVAIFSPGHGLPEHAGRVTVVTPAAGPDEPSSAKPINSDTGFRDPYPLSEECFLVARDAELLVMDGHGATRRLYVLPEEDRRRGLQLHEPRPLQLRPREPLIPPRVDRSADVGVLMLANVYAGRNMAGVKPGEIKSLLVMEALPKPVNFSWGMEPVSFGGSFLLERVLGTVPVEADGSVWFEVPAMRSVVLAALDEQGRTIKRMQSFVSVMPGEIASCVGCHERRTQAVANPGENVLLTLKQPPAVIDPIRSVPEVLDFPRDIQPILDRHCVACHGYDATSQGGPRSGGVILTGDRGPVYSHSYFTLTARGQIADGRNRSQGDLPPRRFGSGHSLLMDKIDRTHHDVRLSEHERTRIRLWLDTGATYPGTYAALGTGMVGGYAEGKLDRSDTHWPSVVAAKSVLERRCAQCHSGQLRLPDSPSDDLDMPPWKVIDGDPRLRFSRHVLYNLTRPEKSLLLLAPLSAVAGGYGCCRPIESGASGGETRAVFVDQTDSDYAALLAAVQATRQRLNAIQRFDMPGFSPHEAYLREMTRFGIATDEVVGDAVDIYETDRAYWRSLWWKPEGRRRPPSWAPASSRRGRGGMR